MWYRRITEYVDTEIEEPPNKVPVTSPVIFGKVGFSGNSIGPTRADEAGDASNPDEATGAEAEVNPISFFMRVRVVSQDNRTKPPATTSIPAPQSQRQSSLYSRGDFDVMQALGVGRCSTVFLAQSKHNQRFYGLKVLKKSEVVRQKQVKRIYEEMLILRELKHSLIIKLWGSFQDPKNLYRVMDFAQGGDLFSLLRRSQASEFLTTHWSP